MSEPKRDGYLEGALGCADEAETENSSSADLVTAIAYTEDFESGRTFAISPQVETILGYTQEEWMGDASLCLDRIHPEDRDRVVAACEIANEDGVPYSSDYRIIARDGHIVWIHDEAVLIRGSNGQPLCWQGIITLQAKSQ
jgi:PAS domain S-box-containing protein